MGDTRSVAVAPHCVASPVGTIASAHFTASVPNFLAPEWHGMRVPPDGPTDPGRLPKGPRGTGPRRGPEREPVGREYAREGETYFGE